MASTASGSNCPAQIHIWAEHDAPGRCAKVRRTTRPRTAVSSSGASAIRVTCVVGSASAPQRWMRLPTGHGLPWIYYICIGEAVQPPDTGATLERPEAVGISSQYMLRSVECDEYFKKAAAKEDKILVPRCPPVQIL